MIIIDLIKLINNYEKKGSILPIGLFVNKILSENPLLVKLCKRMLGKKDIEVPIVPELVDKIVNRVPELIDPALQRMVISMLILKELGLITLGTYAGYRLIKRLSSRKTETRKIKNPRNSNHLNTNSKNRLKNKKIESLNSSET